MEEDDNKAERDRRGIQSVEVGGQLLLALAHQGRPLALKDLAREAGMAPAKAHPYLVSFGKLGLIEQDEATGRYGLGPLALQLGLISLQQADPVRVATPLIAELALRIGHTVAIAVWGTRGPTIVRLEESPAPVHVNMRHGTVVSVTDTASGRLFAAYLPPETVKAVLEDERRREQLERERPPVPGMPRPEPLPTWEAFEQQLPEVRAHGMSRSEGAVIQGISAMSAPVFDHTGTMVLAVTAIGPTGLFDTRWEGPISQALQQCARAIGRRLGERLP
ncbi:IclR family transcriptional regulator [Eleftheria terrae]|uniref:IclR family transcriptional regulator n=1 Tax=Eleftheria terrae TaxID=1597781 RepID=UPI00263A4707|nr:IclR family transcriptional regulator [Eleftheria terrae]WKB51971.1 IclR family transcriptional regulator [Eleftheria terrae]